MNWFRSDSAGSSDGSRPPSSTPDANELRRRRLAKLEEAQAAEKARRQELEERRKRWEAEKAASEAAAPPPPSLPSPTPPSPQPQPRPQPQSKVPAAQKRTAPLPSVEAATSKVVAKCLGIALTPLQAIGGAVYDEDMVEEMKREAGIGEEEVLFLKADLHADDVLIRRINAERDPLSYLFGCFERCGGQLSEMISNRKIAGEEHAERRAKLEEGIEGVERRVLAYAGMLLNGAFMETDNVHPEAFARAIFAETVPAGFVKRLLQFYAEEDAPGLDEIFPVLTRVFMAIRERAKLDMKLSSSSFLKPLNALLALLEHKELCLLLTSNPSFLPRGTAQAPMDISRFTEMSYMAPFFTLSALPGLPLHMPMRVEDPTIAASMFPNASVMNRATMEGALYSLRSSIAVARARLHQICLSLCKAGAASRSAVLGWFGTILNLNKKRSGMQVSHKDSSGDGFMMNVMHVLLKLCEPIVDGGWKLLQKVDPTFPQSSHLIDYEDETRLAADSDMLRRWWVDPRNENAQESLTRQLEVAARESGLKPNSEDSSNGAGSSSQQEAAMPVVTNFNFVTECFWLAMRAIQLGFIAVENMYEETILKALRRMKELIDDMEAAKENGSLPPQEEMQLRVFKQRFDSFLSIRFCYDVYVQDPETLASLVRFASADAEWLMKKLLTAEPRESVLPLPVPADATFASLPEHTVETITTVLLTTMRVRPDIVDQNISLLDEIVSFCIIGAASPLHVKNPYLRAKLVEFLWTIFPRGTGGIEDEDEPEGPRHVGMEALFTGHELSRKYLAGALFRLYVDVEHTGSHTQFYDKFSIRYQIGSIVESLWYLADYRKSVRDEARDEARFLRFVNMMLNDANHLLDSVLDDLEEMHTLELLVRHKTEEWESLSDEEKKERVERLKRLESSSKAFNQLANNNVKLLWLLTDDAVVRRIFLRDEMVSRLAEMLNYLLERLCGQRCQNLKVSEPDKVFWKPRVLLTRILQTYVHFAGDTSFARAVGLDGRSYRKELIPKAVGIASRKKLPLGRGELQSVMEIAQAAERAVEEENEEEAELGDVPDEFLDPIMSSLMRNPVRLPTSGNIMDRAVISRILLSDKVDPFNRKLLTEDMLIEEPELKARIETYIRQRKNSKK